jgi:hypothetical protein
MRILEIRSRFLSLGMSLFSVRRLGNSRTWRNLELIWSSGLKPERHAAMAVALRCSLPILQDFAYRPFHEFAALHVVLALNHAFETIYALEVLRNDEIGGDSTREDKR